MTDLSSFTSDELIKEIGSRISFSTDIPLVNREFIASFKTTNEYEYNFDYSGNIIDILSQIGDPDLHSMFSVNAPTSGINNVYNNSDNDWSFTIMRVL